LAKLCCGIKRDDVRNISENFPRLKAPLKDYQPSINSIETTEIFIEKTQENKLLNHTVDSNIFLKIAATNWGETYI